MIWFQFKTEKCAAFSLTILKPCRFLNFKSYMFYECGNTVWAQGKAKLCEIAPGFAPLVLHCLLYNKLSKSHKKFKTLYFKRQALLRQVLSPETRLLPLKIRVSSCETRIWSCKKVVTYV